jgi:nicotinamide-nucleotide amidase
MFDAEITAAASALVEKLRASGRTVTTIESCTGGLISAAITAVPGASNVFMTGVVTYADEAKVYLGGVPQSILEHHGAVSRETAAAMAAGALRKSKASLALSATGIAGPGNDGTSKPVGLVYIGIASSSGADDDALSTQVTELRLGDIGRDAVRRDTVLRALQLAAEALALH